MKLKIADLDIDVMKQTRPSRWFRRRGWYWQEVCLPPNGPFRSVGDALRNLTARIESGELAVDARKTARHKRPTR